MIDTIKQFLGFGADSPFIAVVYEAKTKSKDPDAPRYRTRICRRDDPDQKAVFNQAHFNTDYATAVRLANETGYDVVTPTR